MSDSSTERGSAGFAAQGVVWLVVYVLVAVTPLLVALTADPPPGRSFWVEFSVGLGFVGLAVMGLQFAIVSRFSAVNAPFGLDAVLHYHREISYVAFAMVLAHPAILMVRRPELLELLNPVTAHWAARFGLTSVLALALLIAASVWRKRLGIRYEVWRVTHGLLAVIVIVTALVHIEQAGYYVDGPWKRALWIAMSAVFIALLVNVRLVKPIRLMRRPWEIASVTPERGSAWTVALRPIGHDGVRFLPGQFAWLRVDTSPFSVQEHPFSFSSSAERTDEVTFTIKEAGDWTSTVGSIELGTRAYLDGPFGVFSCDRNEGPRFVFVAGGVGIGPIMSMLRTLADRGDRRPCLLIYGNPTWDGVIYREELDELTERLDLTVVHVLDEAPEGWEGETGFVDRNMLARHLGERPDRARYFMCGPTAMMGAVEDALHELAVPGAHIDFEQFDLV